MSVSPSLDLSLLSFSIVGALVAPSCLACSKSYNLGRLLENQQMATPLKIDVELQESQ